MKLQCQTRELLDAVNLVAGVVPGNPTRPILQSILLKGSSGGLQLQSTDLEVGLSVQVDEVAVEGPGTAVIPAARLHGILRESHHPQTSIEVDSSSSQICIRCGNSQFKIPLGPADEFPQLEFNAPAPALRAPRQHLLDMLRKTAVAAAKDATRYQMHSVLFDFREDRLRLVSTDGKRMAVYEMELGPEESEGVAQQQFIVPLKGVDLLTKILSTEEDETVELRLDQGEITYISDRVSLSSKLVEGRFPEYERAIPAGTDRIFDLAAEELILSLRQAALMTTKETNSVQLSFGGGRLVLSTQASNIGESRIEMEANTVEGGDEEFVIQFNPNYLIDMVKATDAPTIRGHFKDRKTAGLFTVPEEVPSYRHIVMPLVTE